MQRIVLGLLGSLLAIGATLAPDALAFDDTCATAESMPLSTVGTYVLLNREVTDLDPVDHYRGTLDPGWSATFEAFFSHNDGNIDLRLWNGDCTVLLDSSASNTDGELATWTNHSTQPVDVVVEVYLNGSGSAGYMAFVNSAVADCQAEDDWEPSDSCATPYVIPFTPYLFEPGRTLQPGNDDFYEITVPAYAQLDAYFQHDAAAGDIDVSLYDTGCANWLGGSSTYGDEYLNLDNFSPVPRTFIIHVYLADAAPCHHYALSLRGQAGSNYCTSSPNSTGFAASVLSSGDASIASGGMTFFGDQVPWGSFGLFFYGPGAGNVPFGNGTRCVTGTIVRSPVLQSFKGAFTWSMVHANQASTPNPIVPGATYNFQCWFRDTDAGGAMFNLTDGYRVAFTP